MSEKMQLRFVLGKSVILEVAEVMKTSNLSQIM